MRLVPLSPLLAIVPEPFRAAGLLIVSPSVLAARAADDVVDHQDRAIDRAVDHAVAGWFEGPSGADSWSLVRGERAHGIRLRYAITDLWWTHALDTALSTDGRFGVATGDVHVMFDSPIGEIAILVSGRYTWPDARNAAVIAGHLVFELHPEIAPTEGAITVASVTRILG